MGTAATRAKNKYSKKAYDRIVVLVPIGERQYAHCPNISLGQLCRQLREKGYKSTNEFITTAIKEKQEREKIM